MLGRSAQLRNFHTNFSELIELHEFQIYAIEKFV
jgi:hypothetical protein